jgi:streptogramin lyase
VVGTDSDNVFRITPAGAITEIIDASGDGTGNTLDYPIGVAVDGAGNVYVAGYDSGNVFRITPAGTITEIIDAAGDGGGNALDEPFGVAVDGAGNVYVTGYNSSNAFRVTPLGTISEIIDITGAGAGAWLSNPLGIAADGFGNVYVAGSGGSSNAFRITPYPFLCEVAMSQKSYLLDDVLEMTTVHLANLSAMPIHTRLRLQLRFGGSFSGDVIDVGADGSFGLIPGFDGTLGPIAMFPVPATMPQGTWSVRCAMESPESGAVQAEGSYPFEVQ